MYRPSSYWSSTLLDVVLPGLFRKGKGFLFTKCCCTESLCFSWEFRLPAAHGRCCPGVIPNALYSHANFVMLDL